MQGLPDGALPSLEATKATFEKMQAERIAANSASGPRARAQEQLSALEASLSRVSPGMYEHEAYKKALRACQEAYSVGLSSGGLLPQQPGQPLVLLFLNAWLIHNSVVGGQVCMYNMRTKNLS